MNGPFKLPELPFALDALEDSISKRTMEIHYCKGHASIVEKLNTAFMEDQAINNRVDMNDDPNARLLEMMEKITLQEDIKYFGGGHIIHSLFWENLAPVSCKQGIESSKAATIKKAIEDTFGSYSNFQEQFKAASLNLHGNGWCWLGLRRFADSTHRLEIVTTHDHDILVSHTPIIAVDIAEHAYFLDRENNKGEYIELIWDVINFVKAEERYTNAMSKRSGF